MPLPQDTPPTVTSVTRVGAEHTSASNVDFTVTFSEPVTGVDTASPINDFVLTASGVINPSITSISGSGTTYVVTVDTGSGNGTIRLDVVDDNSIMDANNNPIGGAGEGNGNFSSGDSYTVVTHQSITLTPGWNLVSFNLHPADTRTELELSSIEGNYDLVYAWDATGSHSSSGNWLRADNISASPDRLLTLDEKMGFWIHMTSADILDLNGSIIYNTNIKLMDNAGGWKLVAYPSATDQLIPSVLQDHGVGTDFSLIYAYYANDNMDP